MYNGNTESAKAVLHAANTEFVFLTEIKGNLLNEGNFTSY